jgi:hypothetical protein
MFAPGSLIQHYALPTGPLLLVIATTEDQDIVVVLGPDPPGLRKVHAWAHRLVAPATEETLAAVSALVLGRATP